jgi:hypothetical protein
MDSKSKLRNNLIQKIQQLPDDKLKQVNDLLDEMEAHANSKQETLQLAGSWRDLSEELFNDLTSKLHHKRNNDRQII